MAPALGHRVPEPAPIEINSSAWRPDYSRFFAVEECRSTRCGKETVYPSARIPNPLRFRKIALKNIGVLERMWRCGPEFSTISMTIRRVGL